MNQRNFPYVSIGDRRQLSTVYMCNAIDASYNTAILDDNPPLADLLENIYAHVVKRTRLAAGLGLLRDIRWGTDHAHSFQNCERALEN